MIRTTAGQNIVDVAITAYGDAQGLLALLADNNTSPNIVLTAGDELATSDGNIINQDMANYYADYLKTRVNTLEKPLKDLNIRITTDADRVISDGRRRTYV